MTELRSIKTVVLGMTVILVLMFAAVIWGMTRDTPLPVAAQSPRIQLPTTPWQYNLPAGTVASIDAAGAALAITLDTAEGRRIIVLDPQTGTVRGTILASAPHR